MIAEVIVDIPSSEVDRIFDYTAAPDISVGSRVLVSFGKMKVNGFVINIKEKSDFEEDKLKPIIEALDPLPALTKEMIELMRFIVRKYHVRMIDALRLFVPSEMRTGKVKELTKKRVLLHPAFSLSDYEREHKLTDKQRIIIEDLLGCEDMLLSDASENYSAGALKKLRDTGAVIAQDVVIERSPYKNMESPPDHRYSLTEAQSNAIDRITKSSSNTILLRGVTGSGKTEVYMRCISHYLSRGKTAIMLVPEISLTPQMMRVFRARFGEDIALLHSGLSAGERYDEWLRLRDGRAKIAIGARSAVFAPLQNIGIIIIDEEHDQSYSSDSNPRYLTHEVAAYRRELNSAKLVLGSATPAVENYLKAEKGIYELVEMSGRINKRPLPEVVVVSMEDERRAGNSGMFSSRLVEELEKCLSGGNQAILFVNRRGHTSFVMCKKCGYVARCPDCDITLKYHSEDSLLKCHYCSNKYTMEYACPDCGSTVYLSGKTGTQKVVAELQKLFSTTEILRMDIDSAGTKDAHAEILNKFAAKKAQILVGTQMVTKGHDFPSVTLVGILDADQSLYYTDYRSAERTFQLITQVSGRSGRDDKEGIVVLQTYAPRHFVLKLAAAQDYTGFYKREINIREVTKFPPYAKIVRVLCTGSDEQTVQDNINKIFADVKTVAEKNQKNFLYFQKMKAPIKRISAKYRYQILVRLAGGAAAVDNIVEMLYNIVDNSKIKGAATFLEVNPGNMS